MSKLEEQLRDYQQRLAQDKDNIRLNLDIIECHRALGQFDAAWQQINHLKNIDAAASEFPAALLHLSQGELKKAEAGFTALLETMPQVAIIAHNLAFCLLAQGHIHQADKLLNYYLNPESLIECPQLFVLSARIKHHLHELEEALQLLAKVQSKNPDNAESLGLSALLHYDNQALIPAYDFAQKALSLDNKNLDAKLVILFHDLSKKNISSKDIEALEANYPFDGRLAFGLAYAYLLEDKLDLAEASFKRACQLLPTFIGAWHALGWCQLLIENIDTASLSFEQAHELNPEIAMSEAALAVIAAMREQVTEAQAHVRHAISLGKPSFITRLANVLCLTVEAPMQAGEAFNELLTDISDEPSHLNVLVIEKVATMLQKKRLH